MYTHTITPINANADKEFFNKWLKDNNHGVGVTYETSQVNVFYSTEPNQTEKDDVTNYYNGLTTTDVINRDEYRIWSVVPEHHQDEELWHEPTHIDYKTGLTQRLHPRIWFHHGLVVQIIYYKNFDGTTYDTPVVKEKWTWVLNGDTNMPTSRTIDIQWYRENDELVSTNPDVYEAFLMPLIKPYKKYYPTTSDRVVSIQRRRTNVIRKLEEDIMTQIAVTETAMDIPAAIALGQAFMTEVSTELSNFIQHGVDDLATKAEDTGVQTTHPWLTNDLAALGMGGTAIYQFLAAEVRIDISDEMSTFDYNTLPNE